MIDFRYHLVSIVAIFLALTIGIVLGSTVLARPVKEGADAIAQGLRDSNLALQEEKSLLQQREKGNDDLVEANAGQIVGGVLAGERVLVIEAPGVDEELRPKVDLMLKASGAEIAGRANLRGSLLASDQEAVLDKLTESLRPSELEFADQATAYDRAGELLGYSLLTKKSDDAGTEAPGYAEVLAGLAEAGYVTTTGKPRERARLALLVAPDIEPGGNEQAAVTRSERLLQVAKGLDKYALGTAIGGKVSSADEAGGLIALLRDGALAGEISSVDTLDMASGRAVAVYALAGEMNGQSGRQYGIGTGASGGFVPESLPERTPTGGS